MFTPGRTQASIVSALLLGICPACTTSFKPSNDNAKLLAGTAVFVGIGVGVFVGDTGVFVAVGGTGVLVGVFVGDTGVFVAVGGTGVLVGVLVGGAGVLVGVLVGGIGVLVGVGVAPVSGPM